MNILFSLREFFHRATAFFLLLLVFFATPAAFGEPKKRPSKNSTEKDSSTPAPPKTGSIRLWRLGEGSGPLTFSLRPEAKSGQQVELFAAVSGQMFSDYRECPTGTWTLTVTGKDLTPIAALPLKFGANTTSTIVFNDTFSSPQLTWLDDSPPPRGIQGAALVIHVWFPFRSARIAVGDLATATLPAFGQTFRIEGLAVKKAGLTLTGVGVDGTEANWSSDTQLVEGQQTSILVAPDRFGRLRPRLFLDGHMPAAK